MAIGRLSDDVWPLDLTPGEQHVLLALANHGRRDGSGCYPSVDLLAWETGYGWRQIQRALTSLKQRGIIVPVAHERGGRGKATEYRIDVSMGVKKSPFERGKRRQNDAHSRPQNSPKNTEWASSATEKGVKSCNERASSATIKGVILTPQPLPNRREEPSKNLTPRPPSRGVRAERTPMHTANKPDRYPLDENWRPTAEMLAFAEQEGLTPELVALAANIFLRRFPRPTYEDTDAGWMWRWQDTVKPSNGGWEEDWFADDGEDADLNSPLNGQPDPGIATPHGSDFAVALGAEGGE